MPQTAEPALDLSDALDAIAQVPADGLTPEAAAALHAAHRAITRIGDTNTAMWAVQNQPTISVKQAAALLQIDRITGYDHVKTGDIPSIKIGRRVRVPSAPMRRMLGIEDA
ncbi:helix-turn-helix domain-containing protein [Gordonia aichiensis]|uniref:Helix-turn-helix domain-containing protein n=1 Tax=Gordonia aichiensis NBRC 108223 TaxID=1220583 RepID=L7KIH9_9ACTN|nr:helix-turn-helix domain-containing protein [Gordonia aichiensis]GAC47483.1 hypothetical protein GOACH_03_05050 [Gordonia aichiensis NBRC 108223]